MSNCVSNRCLIVYIVYAMRQGRGRVWRAGRKPDTVGVIRIPYRRRRKLSLIGRVMATAHTGTGYRRHGGADGIHTLGEMRGWPLRACGIDAKVQGQGCHGRRYEGR